MRLKSTAPRFLLLASLLVPAASAQGPEPTAPPIAEESLDESAVDDLKQLERQAERRFEEDDLDAAIALYRQLADRQKNVDEKMRVLVTIAWLDHLRGLSAAVLETLTGALILKPDYPFEAELYSGDFRQAFYEAQTRALAERREIAENSIREGLERMRQGRYDDAADLYQQALSYLPDHPQALYNAALTDLNRDLYDDAIAGFQKVLALDHSRPDAVSPKLRAQALNNLGYLYMARQLDSEAQEVLREAVTLDPDNPAAWTNLGVARRRLGDKVGAAEAVQRAYRLDPSNPEAINNLALSHLDAENWVAAVGLLVEATQKTTDDPRLWLNLGRAQRGMGNRDGARHSFQTVIRLDANDAAGLASSSAFQLTRMAYEAGDHPRALSEVAQALKWRPQMVEAWIYQGVSQQALGDLEAAQRSFEEARRLDPTQAEIHNNLGSVYFDLGLLGQAAEAFERALTIDPSLESARDNLAAVRQVERGERSASTRTGRAAASASTGRSSQLGWRFASIDYSALGLTGVMIEAVKPGSPAARAGFEANDLLLKVDGRDISNVEELEKYLNGKIGRRVSFDLLRANVPQRFELKVQ